MNKFISLFRFSGLFLSWIAYGFGERPRNVLITAIIIAFSFSLIFYYSPNHFEINNKDHICTEFDRFCHLCCISINIMTSLEITGVEPRTNLGRILIIGEIFCGAIALLFLIPMLINRISER